MSRLPTLRESYAEFEAELDRVPVEPDGTLPSLVEDHPTFAHLLEVFSGIPVQFRFDPNLAAAGESSVQVRGYDDYLPPRWAPIDMFPWFDVRSYLRTRVSESLRHLKTGRPVRLAPADLERAIREYCYRAMFRAFPYDISDEEPMTAERAERLAGEHQKVPVLPPVGRALDPDDLLGAAPEPESATHLPTATIIPLYQHLKDAA